MIFWLVPVLWRGHRAPLQMQELGAIDQSLHSIETWRAFIPYWTVQRARHAEGKSSRPLLIACSKAFTMTLLAPIFPLLIWSAVSMARSIVVLDTINFISSYQTQTPKPLDDGWGLVGGTFLIYAIYAISLALGHVAAQRSALALRGALMEAIYRKSLLITVETAVVMGAGAASNLMSVDVKNITENVVAVHDVWTSLVQTGLGLYIIWTQIGLSFVSHEILF